MPIYEYQCQKCGHEFEREQRIIEDPIKKCPSCKAQKAKRLIFKTSFVLKGSGWYNDLYSSAGPDAKSSDAKGDSDKSDSDSASSDSSDSSDSTSSDDSKSTEKKDKAAKADSKTDSKKKKKDSGKKKSAA